MREVVQLFQRELRNEDFIQFQEPINVMKKINGTSDGLLATIGEGESFINTENNSIITKKDGKFFQQIVENNIIKLEEI